MNNNYFFEENAILKERKEYFSESRKYKLEVTPYKTKEGYGDYSLGLIFDQENNLIMEIRRNYRHFPFAFVEKHNNGNDYLICGENYQGYTIVELNTRKKVSYNPDFGFCWINIKPSPDKTILAVEGCYWACPCGIQIYDFSDPMNLPLIKLCDYDDVDTFFEWKEDNSCTFGINYEVRKSDRKSEYEFTKEDWDEIDKLVESGTPYEELMELIQGEKTYWKRT